MLDEHESPGSETLQLEWFARKYGWRVLPMAVEALSDESALVREGALVAIELAVQDALDFVSLHATVKGEPSKGVRAAALEMLESFGSAHE